VSDRPCPAERAWSSHGAAFIGREEIGPPGACFWSRTKIDRSIDPKQVRSNWKINKPSAAVPLPQQSDDWKIALVKDRKIKYPFRVLTSASSNM
jgi:hypothetical protein